VDVKRLACLSLVFAASGWAEEAADRASIERVIAALNQTPRPVGLFTADFDGSALPGALTVTISHEPWGEATIGPLFALGPAGPKITIGRVRFITGDVALVEGAGGVESTPLLFVVRKEIEGWKIASVHTLRQGP
jgi:hypothetical protein